METPEPRPPLRQLTLPQRQKVFRDLVSTQDRLGDVRRSRSITASRWNITEEQLRDIEEDGVAADWPIPDAPPAGGTDLVA